MVRAVPAMPMKPEMTSHFLLPSLIHRPVRAAENIKARVEHDPITLSMFVAYLLPSGQPK